MKKHNNSRKKNEQPSKRAKSRGLVQRDTKEVLAELVGKLKEKLDPKKVVATSAGEKHQRGELRPNLDRLTVGVDLGDQWSHYCILGLEGERLAEGQLRTRQEDFATLFKRLNGARVVVEVGTHSAWVHEVICGYGHEVLVANPRSSLEALKAYSLGDKAGNEKGPAAELLYDQRAIQLDPNFAMGYMAVGIDYSNLGELGRASEYFTKAFQLREHASEREKLAITANYYVA